MVDRREMWLHLERSLTALVDSLSSKLGDKDRELLVDFVENREYGVALEWLYLVVVNQHIELAPDQEREVKRLAEIMNIDLDSLVEGRA
jgi:hypothetical protein